MITVNFKFFKITCENYHVNRQISKTVITSEKNIDSEEDISPPLGGKNKLHFTDL